MARAMVAASTGAQKLRFIIYSLLNLYFALRPTQPLTAKLHQHSALI